MASSKSPLPIQIQATYGRFVEFDDKMELLSIQFGRPGELLYNLDPIPTFNLLPRPIRVVLVAAVPAAGGNPAVSEVLESEMLFKMAIKDWRTDTKRTLEDKEKYEDHATRLTAFLNQSYSGDLRQNQRADETTYRAAFKAKDYRQLYQMLKLECTQISVIAAAEELWNIIFLRTISVNR